MADQFIDNPEQNTPAPAASAAAPSAGTNPALIKALIAKQQSGTLTKDDAATAVKAIKTMAIPGTGASPAPHNPIARRQISQEPSPALKIDV